MSPGDGFQTKIHHVSGFSACFDDLIAGIMVSWYNSAGFEGVSSNLSG
jgi:hypothetical protein